MESCWNSIPIRAAIFFLCFPSPWPHKTGSVGRNKKKKKKKCILMYNQGNMRLHVDLFIKYVSNNVYSDNNHGQPQSILNMVLTFFSSLYFMTTFCGLFSVWYWYHWFFYLVGSPKVGGAGDGKHTQKYGHPKESSRYLYFYWDMLCSL